MLLIAILLAVIALLSGWQLENGTRPIQEIDDTHHTPALLAMLFMGAICLLLIIAL